MAAVGFPYHRGMKMRPSTPNRASISTKLNFEYFEYHPNQTIFKPKKMLAATLRQHEDVTFITGLKHQLQLD